MGDNVEIRRKWIDSNVSFTLEEGNSILDNQDVEKLAESDEDYGRA